MNHRAKFDAASFMLGREICNYTNTHTKTNKQTVTDISTLCLLACVDNKCNLPNNITFTEKQSTLETHTNVIIVALLVTAQFNTTRKTLQTETQT